MSAWKEDPTRDVTHRPWPLPPGPWVMAQRWSDLLFAHWPVSMDALRALVPPALTLDLYEQTAWVTVTPFYLSHLRARALPPLPWGSEFPELNVRTYVTVGGKPGVFFFSLDAGSALAVAAARALYHLPYFQAVMSVRAASDGNIEYRSRRVGRGSSAADFVARYAAVGPVSTSKPHTLDHWLTERYCLYAVDSRRRTYRAEIHHRPWPLQPAKVEIELNTMALAAGIELSPTPARLSFAHRLDVVAWLPERIAS